MERRGERMGWLDRLWILVFGVLSSAWCLTAASGLSATFDEPFYIASGLDSWRSGSHRELLKKGTMPLPIDVVTYPLFLWEELTGTRLDPVNDLAVILPWARAGTLVFWWLLLGYACWGGRQLAGAWGGRLAVALLALEPCFLAHASLATTDIAISACLLAFVCHFRSGRDKRWLLRVGVPACWFAAAVLAKASGLVFAPICMIALELERWLRKASRPEPCPPEDEAGTREHEGGSREAEGNPFHLPPSTFHLPRSWTLFGLLRWPFASPFGRDALGIGLIGMALVFIWCGCDWRAEPSFVAWAHGLPEGLPRSSMVWLAEHLCIFSNAGVGIVKQVTHNMRGHGVYLLGEAQPRAIWYYFPLALTIKLTLPLLLLLPILAAVRTRTLLNGACLAAAALLLFSLNCRVQIGIRLVLPMVTLAVVGLAAATVHAWHAFRPGWRRLFLSAGVSTGVAWTALVAFWAWPHALCYTNELWGGTERGYLWLSDSNYDWGQGLQELTRWQRERGIDDLDVWYFGTDPAVARMPVRVVPLHLLGIRQAQDIHAQLRGRYLAVSTTLLHGAGKLTESHQRAAALLRSRPPAARTTTYLIYDLASDPPEE